MRRLEGACRKQGQTNIIHTTHLQVRVPENHLIQSWSTVDVFRSKVRKIHEKLSLNPSRARIEERSERHLGRDAFGRDF